MSKNDLIEKANARARVKSQVVPASPVNARMRPEDQRKADEQREADVRQKRIDSGGGRVVVRRRSRQDELGAAAAPEARDEAFERQPEPAVAEPVHEEAWQTVAPVAESRAEVESAPQAVAPSAPERVETPAAPEPPSQPTEAAAPAPTQGEAPLTAAPEVAAPIPAEPARAVAPAEPEVRRPQPAAESQARPAVRREQRTETAKVIYRPERPSQSARRIDVTPGQASQQPRSDRPEPERREQRGGPDVGQRPAGSRGPSRQSIEDILAREQGYVPVQRRAVVVAPPEPRAPARPETSQPPPAGAAPATAPADGGAAPASKTRPAPTSIKEMMHEDRLRKGRGTGAVDERERGGARKKVRRDKMVGRRVGDVSLEGEQFRGGGRRRAVKKELKKTQLTTPKAIKRVVEIEESISVADIAHRMGIKSAGVIKKLMEMGVMATINQMLDHDTASLVASEFGYEVKNVAFDESVYLGEEEGEAEGLEPRPPVVTIMGHVDHGKTTLLDAIRSSKVVDSEAGGITQHIGAYRVQTPGGDVVFLDTPGHEAFTSMRARGAQVTDIVILVVAADDGVMPQTVEALNHAKAADVPIIVAVNKIDKPGAQPDVVKRKLADYGLIPEDWGGQTIFAHVSAKKRQGISELLEMILLQAEVLELRADPDRPARAAVVEAKLDKGRGPVATVLVQQGTLRVGDHIVTGNHFGKIRAMIDDNGVNIEEAGPSTPAQILGLSGVPDAGDQLAVVESFDIARSISEERAAKARQKALAETSKVSMEDLFKALKGKEAEEVRIIVKTDVQGSLEALSRAFEDLSTEKVKVTIIHSAVGAVSESDVMLAATSKAIVIGFNVQPDNKAAAEADQQNVQIRTYSVIYDALDDLKRVMEGKLAPVLREKILGHAEVRDLFSIPKVGVIAGCMVLDGKVLRNSQARVVRHGVKTWEGKLSSLKRFKDDAREVEKGFECGIGLEGFNDLQAGDIIESFISEEVASTL